MASSSKSESSSDVGPQPKPWQSYHTVFTNAKAGMEGVDKEKVQRVVYEMSKGSKYFENEERKEVFMRQKIENMHARCSTLSAADVSHYQKVAEKRIIELEAQRDLTRIWLHVDMDAFYAAVETLSNPSLTGKPMAVGGMSMISTANYEARKYGVRAAMPGFIARKLCPELIFVPTDFKKYTYYSNLTRKVFERYDPNFIAASLDEAYLDITEVCRERGLNSSDIAEELRRGVFEESGLTCSAGVAPNRLLAKVCSDINKPNGHYILPNDRIAVMTFISSLPIRKIGGIGKVTEHILKDAFGINTCEEILQKGGLLCALFSRSSADFFLSVGLGLGSTETPQARQRKSMSNERTFSATNDETFLYDKIAELAEMLAGDLQKEGLRGRTLTLKLKTASFEVRTRAATLHKYICSCADILLHARKLLKAELPLSVRLIGLRVSHFSEEKIGPSDPTQKSITNFVKLRDASGSNLYGCDNSEVNTENDTSTSLADDRSNCDHMSDYSDKNIFDSDQLSDFSNSNFSINENAANNGLYQTDDPLNNIQSEATASEVFRNVSESKSCKPDARLFDQLIVNASGGKDVDEATSCTNLPDSAAVSSSYQQDQFQWVDDYKCSLCGAELPPELIDERREHSDFHFAERLQQECSGTSLSINSWKPRDTQTQNDVTKIQNRRKKHKASPEQGKYVSIEKFFMKKSHNA